MRLSSNNDIGLYVPMRDLEWEVSEIGVSAEQQGHGPSEGSRGEPPSSSFWWGPCHSACRCHTPVSAFVLPSLSPLWLLT